MLACAANGHDAVLRLTGSEHRLAVVMSLSVDHVLPATIADR